LNSGGSPITGYTVYWDEGISGQTLVASTGAGLWTTFTTAAGTVTAGTTYNFWVAAINYVGTGTPSNKLAVLAAQAPDVPAAPTVTATFNSV
jgi:hypothetical protein